MAGLVNKLWINFLEVFGWEDLGTRNSHIDVVWIRIWMQIQEFALELTAMINPTIMGAGILALVKELNSQYDTCKKIQHAWPALVCTP